MGLVLKSDGVWLGVGQLKIKMFQHISFYIHVYSAEENLMLVEIIDTSPFCDDAEVSINCCEHSLVDQQVARQLASALNFAASIVDNIDTYRTMYASFTSAMKTAIASTNE